MLIQNMSLSSSARESRSAASALIAGLPSTISLIRWGGTSIALAIRYCEKPSGSANSVLRISPGLNTEFLVDLRPVLGTVRSEQNPIVNFAVGQYEADRGPLDCGVLLEDKHVGCE